MSRAVTGAVFAIPGDLATPTGGYGYARRVLAEASALGADLVHWPLPGGFPAPGQAALDDTLIRLSVAPTGWAALIDGLALGAFPLGFIGALPMPVVALCHHPLALETGLPAAEAAALRRSEAAALGDCAAVITTSAATARLLAEDYGVPATRITVAPPGTDPAPRAEGSGGPGLRILAVGTLTERKGHDRLIEALAAAPQSDWHLTIAGDDGRDPACATALRAQIARLGLADRVTLAGNCAPDRLDTLYRGTDIFALASHHEGFGMAHAEAVARGLPVVATDSGAVAEATGGAARLVAAGDETGFASALYALMEDREARQALSDAAWQAAERQVRWRETTLRILSVLSDLASTAPERAAG